MSSALTEDGSRAEPDILSLLLRNNFKLFHRNGLISSTNLNQIQIWFGFQP